MCHDLLTKPFMSYRQSIREETTQSEVKGTHCFIFLKMCVCFISSFSSMEGGMTSLVSLAGRSNPSVQYPGFLMPIILAYIYIFLLVNL